jgi:hypothetical protein
VPALLAEVTQEQEVTIAAEATHVVAMLAAETSVLEVAAAQDSAALYVKDAED